MFHCVIMAGGSGTRFWPQSRRALPKQLLSIVGNKTMIRATVDRILPVTPAERIMIVAGDSCVDQIRAQIPELKPESIVAEPQGRNTAPCIALAAYKLAKESSDAVMAVLPADHLIGNESDFRRILRTACDAAVMGDFLITLGIVPDRPETGYGYIEMGQKALAVNGTDIFQVKSFAEKPDPVTAANYISQGNYMWNSGMFIWKVSAIIRAFEAHLPAVSSVLESILPQLNTPEEPAALKRVYGSLENISIDYAIMEKADQVVTIPMDVQWNDVGSWASLHGVWPGDDSGNALDGSALCLESNCCVVSSPHKLAILMGVHDLIVVDTPDALLVCSKDSAQNIKKLQELLAERGYEDLL
ncbi:MAG: mannose-1-phosphate guanylyltransferase [Desulfomonile tiedjei]|uniref:mannose-1-phosphate guanylyltransferase n=1 Tax=Desulfomonile tiedjei TaxID=2358 RepID=A0A9D6V056_9BACT|nr:mannose-1-phosphate guanylyltransferase [Desulfomonile tiedjei]